MYNKTMNTKYSQNLSTLYGKARKYLKSKTVEDWDIFIDKLSESTDTEDLKELITIIMSEKL